MKRDLVIGVDSSTTATKAIAFDARGGLVAEGRAPVPMRNPRPLFYEQDAGDWWTSLITALADLGRQVDLGRAAALAISNQRETFVLLDEGGEPISPGITWLDERGRPDVPLLEAKLGRDKLRQITGKTPDPTPCLYAAHWLLRHEPETCARAAHVVEVHGYLVHRLTGHYRTSWASADPTGFWDTGRRCWSKDILAVLGWDEGRMAEAFEPGTVLGEISGEAARETGLPPGLPVVAGGGDGQAAGLGTGTLGAGRAYLNLGTASVSGVFGKDYATDEAFRTLTSLAGSGFIYEVVLRTGTFLVDWFVKGIFGADVQADPQIYARLEQEAAKLPIGSDGLLLLPYWGGVMTPHWNNDVRGAMIGLSSEHGRAHLYRAMMESIALDEAAGLAGIEAATGQKVEEILTIGGGSRSRLWCQIVADATGRVVRRSELVEASALGAAITAAVGAGWFADAGAAAAAMAARGEEAIEPRPKAQARYAELLSLYEMIYPANRRLLEGLAAFKSGGDEA